MPITGEWWNQNQRPILKQGGPVTADVETADLAAFSVTSEKASVALGTRTATGVTVDPAAGAGLGTTSYTVWRPSVRAEITAVRFVPLSAWSAVTCGVNLQLWTCAGAVGIVTATSTAFGPVGVPLLLSGLTNTCVAACQDVMLGAAAVNACDNIPAHAVLIEYQTSG